MRKVSVVIPAYKVSNYIEACLDSIKNQTYKAYEIIVVIDKCKETRIKLEEICSKYNNLKVYYAKENGGPGKSRNTGAYKATGDIIIFFDGDDIMFPYFIERAIKDLSVDKLCRVGLVNFNSEGVNTDGLHLGKLSGGIIAIYLDTFKKFGGYYCWKCAEDIEFIHRLQFFNIEVVGLEELMFRRLHSDSLTQLPETNRYSALRKSINEKRSQINNDPNRTKYVIPEQSDCELL